MKRALDLRPRNPDYQQRRRLIAEAKAAVLRDKDGHFSPGNAGFELRSVALARRVDPIRAVGDLVT
jgi:hypothetical protein